MCKLFFFSSHFSPFFLREKNFECFFFLFFLALGGRKTQLFSFATWTPSGVMFSVSFVYQRLPTPVFFSIFVIHFFLYLFFLLHMSSFTSTSLFVISRPEKESGFSMLLSLSLSLFHSRTRLYTPRSLYFFGLLLSLP